MARIDSIIFGYRRVEISDSDKPLCASLLLRGGIPCEFCSENSFFVREKYLKRLSSVLFGRVEYKIGPPLGLFGRIKEIKHKKIIMAATAFMIFINILLSGVVWDIRISGNENIPSAKIILGLRDCGFSVGSIWKKTKLGDVESSMLLSSEDLAWININRRGTVAYVEVIEKSSETPPEEEEALCYSNIVATSDCVIEEITVKSGRAEVKVGDTVKAGDVLISGISGGENAEFCRAEGSVRGRMTDRVSVEVSRVGTVSVAEEPKLAEFSLNFFNFSINLLKIYRNLTGECDIIEDVKSYSLPDGRNLPFGITKTYSISYSENERCFTDDELVRRASELLSAKTGSHLLLCDLERIRTKGEFTKDGYRMWSDLVFVCEVGSSTPFYIE